MENESVLRVLQVHVIGKFICWRRS